MSDAWTILVDGSTLDDGDAWEHLAAQGGGTGGEVEVLVDAIRTTDTLTAISASVTSENMTVDILTVASASVQTTTYAADAISQNEATI